MELSPKTANRKGYNIIYFKGSEVIEDCLYIMGAASSMFDMMNVKIVKEIRNSANRKANCETANIQKTVDAASPQIAARKWHLCDLTIQICRLRSLPKCLSLSFQKAEQIIASNALLILQTTFDFYGVKNVYTPSSSHSVQPVGRRLPTRQACLPCKRARNDLTCNNRPRKYVRCG